MRDAPPDNIFARILRGELPSHRVYEDAAVVAILDIYPQTPGHTLVIPRSYSENLFAAPEADAVAGLRAVRRIAPAVQRATDAPGVTVITNTGREAGQMIEYLHWHIVPRYPHDKVSLHQVGAAAEQPALEAMAERIRRELETETD
jgi:histidine triad (HIT) family protein